MRNFIFYGFLLCLMFIFCVCRPEDYKMAEANLEVEENKENVDSKDDDIAGLEKLNEYYL